MALTVKQLNRVKELRSSIVYNAVLGNYKAFKKAKKEYASLVVQDFETVRKLPIPKAKAPLFSAPGIRMFIVALRDFFRVKTMDEKLLKKMTKEAQNKVKVHNFIKDA